MTIFEKLMILIVIVLASVLFCVSIQISKMQKHRLKYYTGADSEDFYVPSRDHDRYVEMSDRLKGNEFD